MQMNAKQNMIVPRHRFLGSHCGVIKWQVYRNDGLANLWNDHVLLTGNFDRTTAPHQERQKIPQELRSINWQSKLWCFRWLGLLILIPVHVKKAVQNDKERDADLGRCRFSNISGWLEPRHVMPKLPTRHSILALRITTHIIKSSGLLESKVRFVSNISRARSKQTKPQASTGSQTLPIWYNSDTVMTTTLGGKKDQFCQPSWEMPGLCCAWRNYLRNTDLTAKTWHFWMFKLRSCSYSPPNG